MVSSRVSFRLNRYNYRALEAGARDSGLVIVRRRPVVFREGEPPLIGLFGLMRAVDLPEWFRGQTWEEPPLTIRMRDGKIIRSIRQ